MRTRTETILEIDLFDLVNGIDKVIQKIENTRTSGYPIKKIELNIPQLQLRLWGIDVEVKQT